MGDKMSVFDSWNGGMVEWVKGGRGKTSIVNRFHVFTFRPLTLSTQINRLTDVNRL